MTHNWLPTSHYTTVGKEQVSFLYNIVGNERMNLGEYVFEHIISMIKKRKDCAPTDKNPEPEGRKNIVKILPFPSLISRILEDQLNMDFSDVQRSSPPELFKISVNPHEVSEHGSSSSNSGQNRAFLLAQARVIRAQVLAMKSFLRALQRQETLLIARIGGNTVQGFSE